MTSVGEFRVEARDDGWVVTGPSAVGLQLVNGYLGYLGDRHYARALNTRTRSTCSRCVVGWTRSVCDWRRWTPPCCCGSSPRVRGWRRRR